MVNKTNTATAEGTAPRRSEVYTPVITHDHIRNAFRKDAAHCAGKRAIKVYGKTHGKQWRSILVDEFEVIIVDTEKGQKLVWRTPLTLLAFVKEYDRGNVINDKGEIAEHVAEEIPFKLAVKDATVTALKERKSNGKPRKPRKREVKPRGKRAINPSFHRTDGIRNYEKVRSKIFTDEAVAA